MAHIKSIAVILLSVASVVACGRVSEPTPAGAPSAEPVNACPDSIGTPVRGAVCPGADTCFYDASGFGADPRDASGYFDGASFRCLGGRVSQLGVVE